MSQATGSSSSHHSSGPYFSEESSDAALPTSFFVFVSLSLYSMRCVAVGAVFFKAHRDLELAIAREAELPVEANAARQADARRRATLAQIKSSRGIEIIDLNSRYFRRSETLAQIEAGDAEIVDIY